MKFLLKLVISALAIIVTSYLLPGIHINSPWTAVVLAAVLSFLNVILKPILIVLTIPITIVTLGIFLIFINAIIIEIATYIVKDFSVDSFGWALLFSVILSIVTSVFEALGKSKEEEN